MKNKKQIIKLIVFIIILLLLGIVGTIYEKNGTFKNYVDKYVFQKEKHENNLPKILTESNVDSNIYAYKDSIIILKNNILTSYSRYGNEEYNLDIEISNPIFSSSDNFLAISEKGGTKIYVISGRNIIWQKNLEENISNIKINANGYLVALTSGSIYKNVIRTFDNKGTELFRDFIWSTYVVDMDISPDNKYVAIAEVNYSGILIQSNIKIISVEKATQGEAIDAVTYKNEGQDGDLVLKLKYQPGNSLVVVYDNHIEVIKNNEVNKMDYSQEDVLFIDLNNRVIKIVNKNSNAILQVISSDLTDIKEYEIEELKNLFVQDNIIALNLGTEIWFYNNSGWLIKKYYANQEINKLVLSNSLAGIVYNDKIELLSL